MDLLALFILNLAVLANGAVYDVDVGRTGYNFNPDVLHNVSIGDTVNFHFYPTNHSVAESTFDKPCEPKSGGVDQRPIFSGFVPVPDGDNEASQMWNVPINTTDPIWLYCSQPNRQHCQKGMSMVINPLSSNIQTLDEYQAAAANASVSSPTEVFGGVLVADDGGQPDEGGRALPTSVLNPNSSEDNSTTAASTQGTTVQPTNGVAPVTGGLIWNWSAWTFLAAVFFVTL